MRCSPETHAGAGRRISNSSAERLRYLGRAFFAATLDIDLVWPGPAFPRWFPPMGRQNHYSVAAQQPAAVKSKSVFSLPRSYCMAKAPVRVAVTGAAGQIGYSILFRIASGEMLGKDQPVILQLLEIPDDKAQKALKGVMMELDDCAFPLLQSMVPASDPKVAFRDVDVALLVGARPRGPGMERKDLLEANGAIFVPQGKALDEVASRDVKVLVVGNPANTNALIAMKNAPSLKPTQFTAMMRLDHNRALTQVAQKTGKAVTAVKHVTIWGNHSATQYPDVFNATVEGKPAAKAINDDA